MEEYDEPRVWQERLRDELLPYAAFYTLGLTWLVVAGTLGTWSQSLGRTGLVLTGVFGGPITGLVSLMMLWRMAMFGIDAGRVAPMVAAVSAAIALMITAFGAVFPALALGQAIAEVQRGAIDWIAH